MLTPIRVGEAFFQVEITTKNPAAQIIKIGMLVIF
jgi:hypothetical protein